MNALKSVARTQRVNVLIKNEETNIIGTGGREVIDVIDGWHCVWARKARV